MFRPDPTKCSVILSAKPLAPPSAKFVSVCNSNRWLSQKFEFLDLRKILGEFLYDVTSIYFAYISC